MLRNWNTHLFDFANAYVMLIVMNVPQHALTTPAPARFTVDEFLRLQDTGVFEKYSKAELIEGEIVCMNAQYSPHSRAKTRLSIELATALRTLGSTLEPLVEVAVQLSDNSMPEPDITLTTYRGKGVVPLETVALVIEVSDTTLDNDLGRKSDLYAAAGVPEYWVIDLNENRALLHEHPSADGYLGQADVLLGEVLRSMTIQGLSVGTEDLVD